MEEEVIEPWGLSKTSFGSYVYAVVTVNGLCCGKHHWGQQISREKCDYVHSTHFNGWMVALVHFNILCVS